MCLCYTSAASAFGIGDLVGAGIQVVGKVGGAMIDKALEDSPEEMADKNKKEAQAREANYQAAIAKIEARNDVTPLEKEMLTRQIAKTMGMAETISNMAAQQEIQRRANRDQLLTGGGIVGVVGDAALNTPSAVMARADLAVKAGIPQSESNRAINGANVLMKTGQPQATSQSAIEAASSGIGRDGSRAGVQLGGSDTNKMQTAAGVMGIIDTHRAEMDQTAAQLEAAKPKQLRSREEVSNLVDLDKGRKIFVEFAGGKQLTELLKRAFMDRGLEMVSSASEADVVYQFDGMYSVNSTPNRDGLKEPVGAYYDSPRRLEEPKTQTSMKSMVGGLLSTIARAPATSKPSSTTGFQQGVLMVANRRFEGKDIRVSALVSKESGMLEPDSLIKEAMEQIIAKVGVQAPAHAAVVNSGLSGT